MPAAVGPSGSLKPVRVELGRAWAELRPYERGFRLDVEIDFDTALIGRQRKAMELSPESFRRELARARTFGFVKDVETLWKHGLALGSSLDNSVALGEDRILNPEGLRFTDEFVRHKALDAVGDLALAGAPLIGKFRSYCGGHKLNFMMLEALFADSSAWTYVDAPGAPRQRPCRTLRRPGRCRLCAGCELSPERQGQPRFCRKDTALWNSDGSGLTLWRRLGRSVRTAPNRRGWWRRA